MANRIALASLPEGQILLPGNAPASGATALIYRHGTTTQVTVYQAETGAATLTQPVTADANGMLPGWVTASQDLDIVASYGGYTAPAMQTEPQLASGVPTVNVRSYGAVGDGVADDTAAIHAARDAAGVGGEVVFPGPFTYKITALTAGLAFQRWRGEIGATLQQAATNSIALTLNAANIIVEGFTIDGAAGTNTGGSNFGIWLNNGAVGSVVRNNTIQNVYKTAILIYCAPVTVQGNTITNTTTGAGIFSQPGVFADQPNMRILDNIIDKGSQAPATAQGYGIQLHGGRGSTTFTATATTGNATLTGVSSFTNLSAGLAITGTNIPWGATIQSLNSGAGTLTMTLKASGTGSFTVSVNYALRGLVVSRNRVSLPVNPTNTLIGIECWGWAPGAIVAENRTQGGAMGISLDSADNGTVSANNTESATQQGIEIANCTNVTVTGNVVDGAVIGGGGITMDGFVTPSTKCTIIGNSIVRVTNIGGTAGKAIYVISNGDHTTIVGNAITIPYGVNASAIYVQSSPSTAILSNMLFNYSTANFAAIWFDGGSSSGAIVEGNIIEGWPTTAVGFWVGGSGTTSGALSTAAAITSIPVNALAGAIAAGTVWVSSAANFQSQAFTTTGAAAGATAIPVTSQTPNFAYPAGSAITIVNPVVDRIILGPNITTNTPNVISTMAGLGSVAVIGSRCRYVYAEQGLASPNVSTVTVGASPWTYTNNDGNPETLYIFGGTVTNITKNALSLATATSATVPITVTMEPGEQITITYSVAPTVRKDVG